VEQRRTGAAFQQTPEKGDELRIQALFAFAISHQLLFLFLPAGIAKCGGPRGFVGKPFRQRKAR
jgi:hypothetical protein